MLYVTRLRKSINATGRTMKTRPRTKLKMQRKNRRCPKCGVKLNNQRKRCKRCAKSLTLVGK